MKKLYRIKANEEFASVIKKGKAFKNTSFVVYILKNELGYSRVGISVPTKLGHAVTRVRTRRQIRAMCDSIIDYHSHTFDIVIIARQGFLNSDHAKNYDLLNKILSEQIGKKINEEKN